jgi:glycerophosphoryl diester phosphodiesterase
VVTVIAHRGWSGKYPENTLLAFREAIKLGVPAVELDAQSTSDGKTVVIHDVMVDRTTNGHGAVRDMQFVQIRELDAGQGERVPTLEEVLDLCIGKVAVQLEVKGSGLEQHLAVLWERYGARPDFYFTSFNGLALALIKKTRPKAPVALLDQTTFIRPGFHDELAKKLVKQAQILGAFAIHPKFSTITPSLVMLIHEAGFLVQAWSVSREITPDQILASGIDGFTTNWPDQYRELFLKS